MAFNIQAILSFTSKGTEKTLNAAQKTFKGVESAGKKVAAGFSTAATGAVAAAAATAPLAIGFAKAASTAAEFEKQVSIVKSLTKGTTQDFIKMENEAKRLGATTSFSATQAAQGLEFLALAGFNAQEATGVLETVLRTAEAGSLDLGRASDIITDSMSALSEAFDKTAPKTARATELSDIMALAQSRANTNIEQLGEAVKFGGGVLASLNIPLTTIIASMGKVADAGLKGSSGGTSLVNMFNKLLKPSDKARGAIETMGIDLDKLDFSDVAGTVQTFTKGLASITNPTKRSAVAIEIFGQRGIRAFNALRAAGPESLRELSAELENAKGSADRIAKARLANFAGQVVSLKSATEGLFIELGNLFIKGDNSFLPILTNIVGGVQQLAQAFQFAAGNVGAFGTPLEELTPLQLSLIEFAMGFTEGISELFVVAKTVFTSIKGFLKDTLGVGGENTKEFGKMVAKVLAIGAIAAPILAAMAAGLFILGPIISTVASLFGVMGSVIGGVATVGSFLLGVVGTIVGVIGAVPAAIIAAVAAVGIGIFGIVNRFDEVKAAFKESFLGGMLTLLKAFASGFIDIFTAPFEFVSNKIGAFFGGGDNAKEAAKSATAPNPEARRKAILASIKNKSAADDVKVEQLNKTRLTAPPSQGQPASAAPGQPGASTPSGGGGQSGGSTQTIVTKIEVDGRELGRAVVRNQTDNNERNGVRTSPGQKRRNLELGSVAVAGGST